MKQRPSVKGRDVVVPIRMSHAERVVLQQMASRADMSVSAFVRAMAETHRKVEAEVLGRLAELSTAKERAVIEAAVATRAGGVV